MLGGEGELMWALFFLPGVVCLAIYEIRLRRLRRKLGEAAFAGLFDDD